MNVSGVIRRLGIEGGLLTLVTDSGQTVELIDPPESLREGMRVEVRGSRRGAEMTIGMLGSALVVRSFREI